MKSKVMPILGKGNCVGMKLVKILDFDTVHSVDTETTINTNDVPSTKYILSDPILHQYTDVFNGLGELLGEYTIQIKPDVVPGVNPP